MNNIDAICDNWDALPNFPGKHAPELIHSMVFSWIFKSKDKDESIDFYRHILYSKLYSNSRLRAEQYIRKKISTTKPILAYVKQSASNSSTDWARTKLDWRRGSFNYTNKKKIIISRAEKDLLSLAYIFFKDLEAAYNLAANSLSFSSNEISNIAKRKQDFNFTNIFKSNPSVTKSNFSSLPTSQKFKFLSSIGFDKNEQEDILKSIEPADIKGLVTKYHKKANCAKSNIGHENRLSNHIFEGRVFTYALKSIYETLCNKSIEIKVVQNPFTKSSNPTFLIKNEFIDVIIAKKRPGLLLEEMGYKGNKEAFDKTVKYIKPYFDATGVEPDVTILSRRKNESSYKCFMIDAKDYSKFSSKVIRDQLIYIFALDLENINSSYGPPYVYLLFPSSTKDLDSSVINDKSPPPIAAFQFQPYEKSNSLDEENKFKELIKRSLGLHP